MKRSAQTSATTYGLPELVFKTSTRGRIGSAHFWYNRNLKTFVNLTRITESEDERILLIIGAGHLGFLKQIVEDSEVYHLESPLQYLDTGEVETL